MKNSWVAYLTVAIVSGLAAIAIAGTPKSLGTQPTISVPAATTSTTAPEVAEAASDAPATIASTVPRPTTTQAPPPPTTAVSSTTTTLPELDRADIVVVAANGASVAGLATRIRDELNDLGYERARPTDGSRVFDETVVYFFPGFERAAELVALDLGADAFPIAPVEDAPEFGALDGDQVVVYLGRDRR